MVGSHCESLQTGWIKLSTRSGYCCYCYMSQSCKVVLMSVGTGGEWISLIHWFGFDQSSHIWLIWVGKLRCELQYWTSGQLNRRLWRKRIYVDAASCHLHLVTSWVSFLGEPAPRLDMPGHAKIPQDTTGHSRASHDAPEPQSRTQWTIKPPGISLWGDGRLMMSRHFVTPLINNGHSCNNSCQKL